jgi:hypothetical protein
MISAGVRATRPPTYISAAPCLFLADRLTGIFFLFWFTDLRSD